MEIRISWANVDDADELASLDKTINRELMHLTPQSSDQFKKVIRKSKYLTLVARSNGKLVGYLQSGHRNTKTHVWVEGVIVSKEFRRKGIARMLVNKFAGYWRDRVEYIVLLTGDENINIFKKLGFAKKQNYMGYDYKRKKSSR